MRVHKLALATAAAVALAAAGFSAAQPPGQNQEPAGPAPRNDMGRVVLDAGKDGTNGIWTPIFGIYDPIAPLETVPFKPWAEALYDARQVHEMEPHARCKASGASRQFLTPYGVEFVELPALEIGRAHV